MYHSKYATFIYVYKWAAVEMIQMKTQFQNY